MDIPALHHHFATLNRADFVPTSLVGWAAIDEPLPIGFGQTISQPSLVLRMVELCDPKPDAMALEIGTGSGYAAALLSPFVQHLTTLECIPQLQASAQERLNRLGYTNVTCLLADGNLGHEPNAPYDIILVSACADEAPKALIDQLAQGGRMVIPLKSQDGQVLTLIEKDSTGLCRFTPLFGVRFVEFVKL